MSHWTEQLFKENPDLFLKTLEELVQHAVWEVDILLSVLHENKVRARRILDLNCGIGRHSVELAKRGISVLGTDMSSRYIQIARRRAKTEKVEELASFRVADMRSIASKLRGEEPFDGVVNLYTSFGYYNDQTNAEVLRQCCELVRPKGFFVLEIMNRDWLVSNFEKSGFSRYEGLIVLEDRGFDVQTSRIHTIWTFLQQKDNRSFQLKKQVEIDHRLWSLHELIRLFSETGWRFTSVCPGFTKHRDDVSVLQAKRILFVAKKKKVDSTLSRARMRWGLGEYADS